MFLSYIDLHFYFNEKKSSFFVCDIFLVFAATFFFVQQLNLSLREKESKQILQLKFFWL
jgi:hypothetical protein